MTAVDRLGVHVRLKTQDGVRGARIPFLREVRDAAETRKVLVEMVQQARSLVALTTKATKVHEGNI
jgi:putative heme iron utilization protein